MRLAIDIQGIQSVGSRSRGIGRYSLEIIKNIILIGSDLEIILVANASLPDLKSEFQYAIDFNHVTYFQWYAPCPLDYVSKDPVKLRLGSLLRSFAFANLHADVILITSFLEGFSDNCLTDFDYELLETPVVSIFYDLIPLIHSNLYLDSNPQFSKYYKSKLNTIEKVKGLLAISNSSAKEARKYLSIDSDDVFNISSACNSDIFNTNHLSEYQSNQEIDSYLPFLLYSGANDPRKNLKSLLEAFSLLSIGFSEYKLVLCGKLLPQEIELINQWTELFKINPNLIIHTGYVSDEYLANLYRKCSLFIFPSLHEGFGLPVLEAMNCGAAVIGSNRTSIPEVIGYDKALFDPTNILELRNLIEKALHDETFRTSLLTNAKIQCTKFSWSSSAQKAIKALKTIVNKYPLSYDRDDLNILHSNNKKNLDILITKILEDKLLEINSNKYLINEVSASIDLICKQTENYLKKISPEKKIINSWKVEGPFDSSYSLALLNRNFTKALTSHINRVLIKNTEGFGDYEPNIDFLKQYPSIYKLHLDSYRFEDQTDVISRNLYPPRTNNLDAKFKLMHSYGWEESEFPAQWINDFNANLDGISVMSNIVKKILINNGLKIPIKVTSLGIDHLNNLESCNQYKLDAKKYKILHISSCFYRKGIDILLKAYGKTFDQNDNVTLVIKTFQNPHNNLELLLKNEIDINPSYPDVLIIKKELTDQEIKSLYLQSDVLVAPSRGEGFGLPIAEAMLLGVPVITTGWGGQLDFCNAQNSWLINYKFANVNSHFNLDNSYWAEPSIDHLSNLLTKLYEMPKAERDLKTDLAQSTIKYFTWDKVASKNIEFVNNSTNFLINHVPKIAWISTWYSRCGIASYSRHLIDKMYEDVSVYSPINEPLENYIEDNIFPTWNINSSNPEDLNQLFDNIQTSEYTSVVIQFNYGFFNFSNLSDLIHKLSASKINIIVVLHSTIDPENDSSKSLKYLVDAFQICDRLLVHTIPDLNRLKNLGLVENVALFPHGILDFDHSNSKLNFFFKRLYKKRKKRIASYGFCLPNKGFKEIIYAIQILRDKNFDVELDIYSAIYNDEFREYFEELKSLINNLGFSAQINICPDYMTDNETITILSKYDLIVFPYQYSSESSSASVRHGLATLRPVMVTPINIFNDIQHLVHFFPGTSKIDLAEGLFKWFENDHLETYNSSYISNRKQKLKAMRFSYLAHRLCSIIKSLEINS